MQAWTVLGAAFLVAVPVGCAAPPQVEAGEPCNSLNECQPGLSCIEGICDSDLSSIAGQVPAYAGVDAAAPAAVEGMSGGTTRAAGARSAGAAR